MTRKNSNVVSLLVHEFNFSIFPSCRAQPVIDVPGALQHIIIRGTGRMVIFKNETENDARKISAGDVSKCGGAGRRLELTWEQIDMLGRRMAYQKSAASG